MTVKNKYLPPLISKIINKLQGAKYFTKLDVCWGFNNVWMKEGDKWKAVLQTNFKPLVMFFGLCNSPATFQTMMNNIFDDFISEGVVVVYLDDILIFTKTLEEHQLAIRRVLQLLKENSLFLNDNVVLLTLNLFAIWALQHRGRERYPARYPEGYSGW